MVLSDAVIKLQQELSEKFKIPTFTQSGGISTVPTSGKVGKINVGVGKFGGETISSFRDSLNQNIARAKQSGGSIGRTSFAHLAQPHTRPRSGSQSTGATQADALNTDFDFGGTFDEGLGGAADFLQNNPTLLIVGLGVIALMVIKK